MAGTLADTEATDGTCCPDLLIKKPRSSPVTPSSAAGSPTDAFTDSQLDAALAAIGIEHRDTSSILREVATRVDRAKRFLASGGSVLLVLHRGDHETSARCDRDWLAYEDKYLVCDLQGGRDASSFKKDLRRKYKLFHTPNRSNRGYHLVAEHEWRAYRDLLTSAARALGLVVSLS